MFDYGTYMLARSSNSRSRKPWRPVWCRRCPLSRQAAAVESATGSGAFERLGRERHRLVGKRGRGWRVADDPFSSGLARAVGKRRQSARRVCPLGELSLENSLLGCFSHSGVARQRVPGALEVRQVVECCRAFGSRQTLDTRASVRGSLPSGSAAWRDLCRTSGFRPAPFAVGQSLRRPHARPWGSAAAIPSVAAGATRVDRTGAA